MHPYLSGMTASPLFQAIEKQDPEAVYNLLAKKTPDFNQYNVLGHALLTKNIAIIQLVICAYSTFLFRTPPPRKPRTTYETNELSCIGTALSELHAVSPSSSYYFLRMYFSKESLRPILNRQDTVSAVRIALTIDEPRIQASLSQLSSTMLADIQFVLDSDVLKNRVDANSTDHQLGVHALHAARASQRSAPPSITTQQLLHILDVGHMQTTVSCMLDDTMTPFRLCDAPSMTTLLMHPLFRSLSPQRIEMMKQPLTSYVACSELSKHNPSINVAQLEAFKTLLNLPIFSAQTQQRRKIFRDAASEIFLWPYQQQDPKLASLALALQDWRLPPKTWLEQAILLCQQWPGGIQNMLHNKVGRSGLTRPQSPRFNTAGKTLVLTAKPVPSAHLTDPITIPLPTVSFFHAIHSGQREQVAALLEEHPSLIARQNPEGKTAHMCAFDAHHLKTLNFLLAFKVPSFNIKDAAGHSLIDRAYDRAQNIDLRLALLSVYFPNIDKTPPTGLSLKVPPVAYPNMAIWGTALFLGALAGLLCGNIAWLLGVSIGLQYLTGIAAGVLGTGGSFMLQDLERQARGTTLLGAKQLIESQRPSPEPPLHERLPDPEHAPLRHHLIQMKRRPSLSATDELLPNPVLAQSRQIRGRSTGSF